jgi:hypothetical protein
MSALEGWTSPAGQIGNDAFPLGGSRRLPLTSGLRPIPAVRSDLGHNDADLAVCATRSVMPVSDPSASCWLRRSRPYVAGQRLARGRGWRRPRRIGSRRRLEPQLCSRLRQRAGLARGGSPIWRTVAPGRGTARTNSRGPSLHLRRIARSPSSRASGIAQTARLHATRSAKSQRCRAPPQPPSYYKNPHRPRRRHAK